MPTSFDRVETYVRQRLSDDPHVWATVLFDEVVDLGYNRAYPTFTRKVRERELRPHCEPCQSSTGRATVDIEHPPGEEALCGTPHRASYVATTIMRRRARTGPICESTASLGAAYLQAFEEGEQRSGGW